MTIWHWLLIGAGSWVLAVLLKVLADYAVQRSSLIALIAAGIEPKGIDNLELHNPLASLKEVIEKNWSVEQKPELFCFGLLEAFDIKQLGALVAPRAIVSK